MEESRGGSQASHDMNLSHIPIHRTPLSPPSPSGPSPRTCPGTRPSRIMSSYFAADNLPSWLPLHPFHAPRADSKTGVELVDWNAPSLWAFVGMVAFNPVFWNTVAQNGQSRVAFLAFPSSPIISLPLPP